MKTESIKLEELEIVHAPEIDMYSMTALWKTAGSDKCKAPNCWLRLECTKNYLKALINKGKNPMYKSYGRNGTYANWMILLSYAQYLSTDMAVVVNDYFATNHTPEEMNAITEKTLAETAKKLPALGVIYFIKCNSFIKIGFTTDIEARMATLQTDNPYDLVLLKTVPGDRTDELAFHEKFFHLHYNNEWFRYEKELLEYLSI